MTRHAWTASTGGARHGATQRFPFTRAVAADPMPAEALEPYKGKCIVMWTSYVSNQLFEVNWRKLETTLQNKHVDATKIDGADPEMKAVRSALWEISGKREYPLVFVWSDASDNFDCIGGADEIQLVSARTLFILPFYSAMAC